MKAHIRRPAAPKILFYGGADPEKVQSVAAFCQQEDISFGQVTASQLGDSLGFLAGVSGFAPAEKPWEQPLPQREAMIFCGIEEKRVRQLLDKMNGRQLRVELKAIMTPHNQGWTFGDLLAELEKEHLALHQKSASPAKDGGKLQ